MRHLIIAAAVGAAAFVAAAAPAHAHHDIVCLPTAPLPQPCVGGLEHEAEKRVDQAEQTVRDAQDAAWAAVLQVWPTITDPVVDGYGQLDAIPDPVCLDDTEVCVYNVRAAVQFLYFSGVSLAFSVGGYALCAAIQPHSCPPPTWLLPKP